MRAMKHNQPAVGIYDSVALKDYQRQMHGKHCCNLRAKGNSQMAVGAGKVWLVQLAEVLMWERLPAGEPAQPARVPSR